ncbi:MAG: hypothetical protein INQ03_16955 [Candidatus Heimdallarchaeota archaeon]|nr:hypothetical protein [Candidatus Heimdallarchaeota archaeon]
MTIDNELPYATEFMETSIERVEGTNIIITPELFDSPYDLLHMEYLWTINGVETNTSSYWSRTDTEHNIARLVAFDPFGANFTQYFNFTIIPNKAELSFMKTQYIYGDTQTIFNFRGTVIPSIFNQNYRDTMELQYSLFARDNTLLSSGTGLFDEDGYGFTIPLNTSVIANNDTVADLYDIILTEEDVNLISNPSGSYRLKLELVVGDDIIVSTKGALSVSLDMDGDFMTDELEILYHNTFDYLDFDVHDTDTNNDGQADPVEYVLGEDADGDGLASFFEDIYGTSDNNPDSDGDGLTDGYGPFGELTYRSDPTNPDTDNDGLTDYEEVVGWQVELISKNGLIIEKVTSDPTKGDTDGDGVYDTYEKNLKTNPRSGDTDGDGLTDREEQDIGTSMLNKDTDFDGIDDYTEVNSAFVNIYYDAEGYENEQIYYLNPNSPDSDNDNITDYAEVYIYKSTGTNKDTDRDGILDWDEINTYMTDINNADTDGDGLADGIEIQGFTIPIIMFSGGVYSEEGLVLEEPEVMKYNVTVVTDPLRMDTDGDGLTDWEELMGDTSNVGDPTSVDSDSDGIIDIFDSQRLVSDFTPAELLGEVEVEYSIRPDVLVEAVTAAVSAGLSTIWNLMKSLGNFASKVIDSFWYWKKKCKWGICVKWPVVRSWSSIKSRLKDAVLSFVKDFRNDVFPTLKNWGQYWLNTLSFSGFSVSLKKKGGFPVGLSVSGSISMAVRNIVSSIAGILDPTINLQVDLEDEAGIDKIKIYQDSVLIKVIKNVNSKKYHINEYFSVINNGNAFSTTLIEFEIYDINGNVRVFNRTTSAQDFAQGVLDAGVTAIKETASAIVDVLEQAWEWTLETVQIIGSAVVDAVNTVVEFVNDTLNLVLNWLAAQFERIWEGFIRDMMFLVTRATDYLNRAENILDIFFNQYAIYRSHMAGAVDVVMESPVMQEINDTLNDVSAKIEDMLPPFDKNGIMASLGGVTDVFSSIFSGTIIQVAIDFLAEKATKILEDVLMDVLESLVKGVFGSYGEMALEVIKDTVQELSASPFEVPFSFSAAGPDRDGFIGSFLGLVEFMRNPAAGLGSMLSSITGERVMSFIDKFMVDNTTKLVSLNDILTFMFKPVVALGIVVSDIFTWTDSIFYLRLDGQQMTYKEIFSNVAVLGTNIENNAVDEPDEILNLISMIIELLQIAYTEVFRFVAMNDRVADNDVEIPVMRMDVTVQTIFHFLTSIPDLILEYMDGYSDNKLDPNYFENTEKKLFFTIFVGLKQIVQLVCVWKYSVKDQTEIIFEVLFGIFDWIFAFIEAIWFSAIAVRDMDTLDEYNQRAWAFEIAAVWLTAFYEPICYAFNHGKRIIEYFPGPWAKGIGIGIYGALALATVGMQVTTSVLGFVATLNT